MIQIPVLSPSNDCQFTSNHNAQLSRVHIAKQGIIVTHYWNLRNLSRVLSDRHDQYPVEVNDGNSSMSSTIFLFFPPAKTLYHHQGIF
jgi:hypothetical protein